MNTITQAQIKKMSENWNTFCVKTTVDELMTLPDDVCAWRPNDSQIKHIQEQQPDMQIVLFYTDGDFEGWNTVNDLLKCHGSWEEFQYDEDYQVFELK